MENTMKILLINPDYTKNAGRDLYTLDILTALIMCKPHKRVYNGFPLALPTLAALTPKEHEVKIIDEAIETIDFDEECDLVGLTSMTQKSTRAYQIAKEFRKKGKTVILGGIHASMLPTEALEHVDVVVQGEAEGIWPEVLEDFANGQLKTIYKADTIPDVTKSPIPRYELVKLDNYYLIYLQTSRGCPYNCDFCTVTQMNGRKMRLKTPKQVISEINHILKLLPYPPLNIIDKKDGKKKKYLTSFFFTDDNFAIHRKHAIAVCEEIIRYQKEHNIIFTWTTQVNYQVGLDAELLALFQQAGCEVLFMGFESLEPKTLKALNKTMNSPDMYSKVIENVRNNGMEVIFSTIIGGDYDTPETVDTLVRFINKNKVFFVCANMLTPFPGTNLFQKLSQENLIINTDYSKYNTRNAVFKPKKMSANELQIAFTDLCSQIYDMKTMIRRSKRILEKAHKNYRFAVTIPTRFMIFFAFIYSTICLCFQKRLSFKVLWPVTSNLIKTFLKKGTLVDLYYLGWVLDNNAFAKSEQKRLTELIKAQKQLKENTVSTIEKLDKSNKNGKETQESVMDTVIQNQ